MGFGSIGLQEAYIVPNTMLVLLVRLVPVNLQINTVPAGLEINLCSHAIWAA